MERESEQHEIDVSAGLPRRELWVVTMASWIGTTLEVYDFLVFGLAMALGFGQTFFPSASPPLQALAAFATFGAGFLTRPLGGLVFGHLGDTRGRRQTLVLSLFGMGACTLAIGLLPGYAQIGVAAPVSLLLLRLLQGLLVGGEWAGGMLIVVENAPVVRRGMYGAVPQTGGLAAQWLAAAAFAGVGMLGAAQQQAWGWRLPFLAAAPLALFGVWLRRHVQETLVFRAAQKTARPHRSPVLGVLREQRGRVLLLIALRCADGASFYLATVFAVTYAQQHFGVSQSLLTLALMASATLSLPIYLAYGAMSDRWGRRRVFLSGCAWIVVFAAPFFMLLGSGHPVWVVLAFVLLLNVGHNPMSAVKPAWCSELFETGQRYSGMSIGAQIGIALAGGLSPLIAQALSTAWAGGWAPVACYLAVMALISAGAALALPETAPAIQQDGRRNASIELGSK